MGYGEGYSNSGAIGCGGYSFPALWSPAKLFTGSEVGGWWDPSDLSSMWQNHEGVTAAAVDSPVGLAFDKSQGLAQGAELITNGGPGFVDTTGWTANGSTLAIVDGELVVTSDGSGFPDARFSFSTTVGTTYKATIVYRRGSSPDNAAVVMKAPANFTDIYQNSATSNITTTIYFVAISTTTTLTFFQNASPTTSGETVILVSCACKSLAGSHLSQASDSKCPILRQSGGLYYLEFDGVDDFLQATFTCNQPIVRVSALQAISFTANDYIYSGGSGIHAGGFHQHTSTPSYILFDGANLIATGPADGADAVTTERYDDTNSRFALNNGSYQTGTTGATNAGGITVGAWHAGSNASNIRWYGATMIDQDLSDANIALLRTYHGNKAGLSL